MDNKRELEENMKNLVKFLEGCVEPSANVLNLGDHLKVVGQGTYTPPPMNFPANSSLREQEN